jgi:integrase
VLGYAVAEGIIERNPVAGRLELPPDVASAVGDVDVDPFAAIEDTSAVWDAETVLRAMPRLRDLPLESCWLCMVGAGLRREEALALTWRDVRRVEVGGRMVVQLAVWRARTWEDGTRATKTARSRRVAAVAEPFATRLWELRGDPDALVCPLGAGNMARTWRRLWGDGRPLASLPYLPLSRMRATHETMMQAAGVPDSVNAAAHGHSVAVAYGHYMRQDSTSATGDVGDMLAGIRGQGAGHAKERSRQSKS